ncbi:hypothetical protein D9M72_539490 [compost metagenome]
MQLDGGRASRPRNQAHHECPSQLLLPIQFSISRFEDGVADQIDDGTEPEYRDGLADLYALFVFICNEIVELRKLVQLIFAILHHACD